MQYAVKEACRVMSSPTTGSWARVERMAKYLKGNWLSVRDSFCESIESAHLLVVNGGGGDGGDGDGDVMMTVMMMIMIVMMSVMTMIMM